jgi:hypothetical protein
MPRRALTGFRLTKDDGSVCSDGVATFYLAGTSTLTSAFSDRLASVSLGSAVSLGSLGRAPDIWLRDDRAYKVVLSGTGVTAVTIDYLADLAVSGSLPRGYIQGFAVSNTLADLSNRFDIAAGLARASTNDGDVSLGVVITKRVDASWTAGSGNGCWDSGTMAATGTGFLFAISNPTTGVVDVLGSASPTAPALPTGYTLARRIYAFRRVSGVNVAARQDGDVVTYQTNQGEISVTQAAGAARVQRTLAVPSGIRVRAFGSALAGLSPNADDQGYVLVTDGDAADQASTAGNSISAVRAETSSTGAVGAYGSGRFEVLTDTSARVWTRTSRTRAPTGDVFVVIGTAGFIDTRGRDE